MSSEIGCGWTLRDLLLSVLASYVSRREPGVKWVQQRSMALAESLTTGPSAVRNAALRERGNEAMQPRFGPLVPAPW